MKSVILGGISALALAFSATPAAAQAVIGGGIGGNLGNFSNSGSVTYSAGDLSQSLGVDLDRALSGSSVSGFAGHMTIGDLGSPGCGCTDFAVFGGIGNAGTFISADVDLLGNGTLFTDSWNGGLYGGAAQGASRISADFANAGQSSFSSELNIDFNQHMNVDNFQSIGWDVSGSGDGFGGALAGGAQF
jgi:hypothetical protein